MLTHAGLSCWPLCFVRQDVGIGDWNRMGLTGSTIRTGSQPDSIQFFHPNWRLDVDDLHEKSAMFEWDMLVSVHCMLHTLSTKFGTRNRTLYGLSTPPQLISPNISGVCVCARCCLLDPSQLPIPLNSSPPFLSLLERALLPLGASLLRSTAIVGRL